jgi:hypothetical protein
MNRIKALFPVALRPLGIAIFAFTLTTPLFAQHQFEHPPVAGSKDIEEPFQVGHQVADLERSVKWYVASGFTLAEGPSAWTMDKELNQLCNTPGAESRTAILKVQGFGSDARYTLVLREYRGISRQNWSKPELPTSATKQVVRPPDGRAFLITLGLLPAQSGAIRTARVEDPDGLVFYASANNSGQHVTEFDAGTDPPAAKVQDINANYRSFQVDNIETVYALAKENDAITVTDGGIVNYNKGRAVLIRDPDAGGFILLWQKSAK